MNLLRTILVLAAILFSPASFAKHWGNFDCTGNSLWNCSLGRPNIDVDTVNFIRTVANADISQWKKGDTITVCSGATCVSYVLSNIGAGLHGLIFMAEFDKALLGMVILIESSCGVSYEQAIVGWNPIYATGQVCTPDSCTSQTVLVGYEPIYGMQAVNTSLGYC